jgi:hypothetical protein
MPPAVSVHSVANVIARLLPNPESATAIIERHHRLDRERLARSRERFNTLRKAKDGRDDALRRRAYLQPFKQSGKLYTERTTGWDDSGYAIREQTADPALKEIQAEIAHWDQRISNLEAQTKEPPCLTGAAIERFLVKLDPNAVIAEYVVEPDGDLAEVRRTIVAKREERAEVARRHRTKAELIDAARAQVHAMAGRGQPKVRPLLEGGNIEFARTKLPKTAVPVFNYVPDGAALVAFLFESELLRKIEDAIEFNFDPSNAMPQAEQARQLAALDKELTELRRNEAALVESIVADGGNAWHFPDAPIEAVLSITIG